MQLLTNQTVGKENYKQSASTLQLTGWLYYGGVRNAEDTRRRILEAATAEFAAYGIAGARVDRICKAAACNKQSIYGYFQSKEGLFTAVFEAMVRNVTSNVAFDPLHLPEYTAHLLEWSRSHPEVLRLTTWYQLERGNSLETTGAAAEVNADKVARLHEAQTAGAVTKDFTAEHLLLLIYRLATIPSLDLPGEEQGEKLRTTVITAVQRLIKPTHKNESVATSNSRMPVEKNRNSK